MQNQRRSRSNLYGSELLELRGEHRNHLYDWIFGDHCRSLDGDRAIFAGRVVVHLSDLHGRMDGRQNRFLGRLFSMNSNALRECTIFTSKFIEYGGRRWCVRQSLVQ